jgi:hypothetical protein
MAACDAPDRFHPPTVDIEPGYLGDEEPYPSRTPARPEVAPRPDAGADGALPTDAGALHDGG